MEQINLRLSNNDWNAAISRTVEVLRSGGIAAVPTETVYGLAAGLDYQSVHKLFALKGRNVNNPFALAFPSSEAISDYCGELSPLSERFVRRCLPGPVSLVLDISNDSRFWELPKEIQQAVSLHSAISCRIPDHPFLQAVLKELDAPVVLTSANKSGQGDNADVGKIVADLGSGIDLILDEGPIPFSQPSTVVKITGNKYTVLREGVLKSATIHRLSATMILFVGRENRCRSPIAEAICEKLLSDKLHCPAESLDQHGIVVLSAGVAVTPGQPANAAAIDVSRNLGLNLSSHRSLRLNDMYVQFADYIFAMTRRLREHILSSWQMADSRLNVLRTDGGDIAEAGCSPEEVMCRAEQIHQEIARRAANFHNFSVER